MPRRDRGPGDPAVRVAGRRLGRLGLDPADPLGPVVAEAVDAADAREHDVARAAACSAVPSSSASTSPREEHVRLLERVVVRLGRAADLVVDREHRHAVGAERLVDQHLHGDPAVGEDRDVHAGGLPAARRVRRPRSASAWGGVPVVVADEAAGRVAERAERHGGRGQRLDVRPARAKNVSGDRGVGGPARRRVDTDSQRTWPSPSPRACATSRSGSARSRRRRAGATRRSISKISSPSRTYSASSNEWMWRPSQPPGCQRPRRELRVRRALRRPDEDRRATAPTTSASR